MRVFLNLCSGLSRAGIPYRVNDYRYIRSHPEELACVIGKTHVLEKLQAPNPILFGAAVFSHPVEYPDFFQRYGSVRRILVPCEWMRRMWIKYFPSETVKVWPVGIDTDLWCPVEDKKGTVLIYDKIRWEHEFHEGRLLNPIREALRNRGYSFREIRYGFYDEEAFRALLNESRAMIFLCEHETQGIAYQQALSSGVPILAWDRGGDWQDPSFYPHRVRHSPVTSVPYFDERCGERFRDLQELETRIDPFMTKAVSGLFEPREFIIENLTLEKCARDFANIAKKESGSVDPENY
jgi:glycosyltransferase involved in cell wall biosynthesis